MGRKEWPNITPAVIIGSEAQRPPAWLEAPVGNRLAALREKLAATGAAFPSDLSMRELLFLISVASAKFMALHLNRPDLNLNPKAISDFRLYLERPNADPAFLDLVVAADNLTVRTSLMVGYNRKTGPTTDNHPYKGSPNCLLAKRGDQACGYIEAGYASQGKLLGDRQAKQDPQLSLSWERNSSYADFVASFLAAEFGQSLDQQQ